MNTKSTAFGTVNWDLRRSPSAEYPELAAASSRAGYILHRVALYEFYHHCVQVKKREIYPSEMCFSCRIFSIHAICNLRILVVLDKRFEIRLRSFGTAEIQPITDCPLLPYADGCGCPV